MFDAKKLTDNQIGTIKDWVSEGAQLADVQKRMEAEMELCLTYMDTRFLVLDLGIQIRNLEEESRVEDEAAAPATEELTVDDVEVLTPALDGKKVTVSVDEIARPGVMASGRVTFSDAQSGMWYVDEMGRLGIEPDTEGYRPTEEDIQVFQRELQSVMEKS